MSDTTKDAVQLAAELASMTRMFHAACADLGAINEALGLDPDDGGAEPIIDAINELKTARDQWVDANYCAPAQVQAEAVRVDADRYQWLRRRAVMVDYSDDTVTKLTLLKDEGPTGEFLDDWIDGERAAPPTGDQS